MKKIIKNTNPNLNIKISIETRKKASNHPVHDLKFSAVLGTISAKSSILIRPAGMDPMVMSKKTIGFLGFGGLWCHSKFDDIAGDAMKTPLPTTLPPTEAINKNAGNPTISLQQSRRAVHRSRYIYNFIFKPERSVKTENWPYLGFIFIKYKYLLIVNRLIFILQ